MEPFGDGLYSQFCSKVDRSSSGVVADEKFSDATSNSEMDLSVDMSVIVLPEPGGPHSTSGRRVVSHARMTSCHVPNATHQTRTHT
jgi:hypothetical protein